MFYVWILVYCFHRIHDLLDYTYLFSPSDYKKIYKHFKGKYGRRNKSRV